jgi:hypothetical protein
MSSNEKGIFGILAALGLPLLLSACVLMTSATPHQAFVENYGWYVGKHIGHVNDAFPPKYGFKVSSKRTANGDIEIEVFNPLANRQCKIFYTYNPQTKIVVSWRYEGTNNQCAINPYT